LALLPPGFAAEKIEGANGKLYFAASGVAARAPATSKTWPTALKSSAAWSACRSMPSDRYE